MKKSRPLSPHLTIYRLPLNAVMSILHRITGVGLFVSLLLFSWWLSALIFSDFSAEIMAYSKMIIFKVIALLTNFALLYHLCTGIRHLFWDSGKGFSVKSIDRSNWLILTTVLVLFCSFWFYVLWG